MEVIAFYFSFSNDQSDTNSHCKQIITHVRFKFHFKKNIKATETFLSQGFDTLMLNR